jgi:hypothetical protein
VRSSRRLEIECHRNIEVIWLLRTLRPDFKTIADFRADNRVAFKSVFRQFTLLCKRLDLFGRELLAVDGTRIKAVNNKDRNFTRDSLENFIKAADERLANCLARLDEGDAAEAATDGARVKNLAEKIEALRKKRGEYDAILRRLERTGEDQISLTDPDSRTMAAHTRVAVGYNVQIAVDRGAGAARKFGASHRFERSSDIGLTRLGTPMSEPASSQRSSCPTSPVTRGLPESMRTGFWRGCGRSEATSSILQLRCITAASSSAPATARSRRRAKASPLAPWLRHPARPAPRRRQFPR